MSQEQSPSVPSTAATLATLARLTLVRLGRGKFLWVAVGIACLPVVAAQAAGKHLILDTIPLPNLLVLAVIPPMFIASSIGEEIEDRTSTYLWSRPLARWTVLVGKLLALAPIAVALVVGSLIVATQAGQHTLPPVQTILGIGAGALAVSIVVAGISTVVPRQGMALAIVYLVFFDLPFGGIPGSIRLVSVTRDAMALCGHDSETTPLSAAIAMSVVAGIWLAVAFRRIRRLES
jgi:ABC-type Na+ efflux pump permease subunit